MTNASRAHVEVHGVREFAAQLKKLNVELIKELKAINRAAAQVVADDARGRAPRQTGNLAASVRAGATTYSGVVRVGSKAVPYAGPIIFGWGTHHIYPQPFIYKALDARRPEVLDAYESGVSRLVEHAFPKAGI